MNQLNTKLTVLASCSLSTFQGCAAIALDNEVQCPYRGAAIFSLTASKKKTTPCFLFMIKEFTPTIQSFDTRFTFLPNNTTVIVAGLR
jgi:hypothetical protein